MSHQRTAAPSVEPVSLEQARSQVRAANTAEDEYLRQLISTARAWCENYTRRAFVSQTWELKLDSFWDERYAGRSQYTSWYGVTGTERTIWVPRPPLLAVSSITYLDLDGNTDTIAATTYRVDADTEPGRITLDYQKTWPGDIRGVTNAVTITHTAGYGTAATDVPEQLRHAILLLVGHWNENREAVVVGQGPGLEVPLTVRSLLDPYCVELFA